MPPRAEVTLESSWNQLKFFVRNVFYLKRFSYICLYNLKNIYYGKSKTKPGSHEEQKELVI
jgi:hypothetical protein